MALKGHITGVLYYTGHVFIYEMINLLYNEKEIFNIFSAFLMMMGRTWPKKLKLLGKAFTFLGRVRDGA